MGTIDEWTDKQDAIDDRVCLLGLLRYITNAPLDEEEK
jgi:hypothetical protein